MRDSETKQRATKTRKKRGKPKLPEARRRKTGPPIDQTRLSDALRFAAREIASNRLLPNYLETALIRFMDQFNRELMPYLVVNEVNRLATDEGLALSRAPSMGQKETAFTRVAAMLDKTPESIEEIYYRKNTKTDI